MHEDEKVEGALLALRAMGVESPTAGIVLGSGLGSVADTFEDARSVSYGLIPGMPAVGVAGHQGEMIFGRIETQKVVALKGRAHLYEGRSVAEVVFAVRLMAALGVERLFLTNAAGGIRATFRPGDLMLIEDHLNLTGHNSLVGPEAARFGKRFIDMVDAYDPGLRLQLLHAAQAEGCALEQGVYAGLLGPSYETPAEIRMLQRLGAHAVGMSTVPEVIALRHLGVPVGALSCITNLAAGLSPTKLSHAEVEETARASRASFLALLTGWIRGVGAKP